MAQSKIDIVFHNLRNFPYWIILAPLYIYLVITYVQTQDTKIYDMARDILIALTTSIGLGRFLPSWEQPPQQNFQTEKGDVINNSQDAAKPQAPTQQEQINEIDKPIFHEVSKEEEKH